MFTLELSSADFLNFVRCIELGERTGISVYHLEVNGMLYRRVSSRPS